MRWVSMYADSADARDEDRDKSLAEEDGDPATAPAASTTDGVGQGSYVTSFTLTREQVAAGIDTARAALPQLLSECSWRSTDAKGWRRVKSGKCAARVWEKGGGGRLQRVLRKLPAPKSPVAATVQLEADASASGSATSTSATVLTGSGSDGSESDGRGVYSVRSSVTVAAPLDAVLKTLDASVLTAHRSFTKIIYGGVVAEATVLSHHDRPRSVGLSGAEAVEAQALTVRWLVCRCSSPMVSDCDLCLQEYTRRLSIDELAANASIYNNNNNNSSEDSGSPRVGRVRDGLHAETELPAAYKLFQSVEMRCCPELLESQRLVRASVPLGGFLLYPTDSSERTDVVFFMSVAHDRRADRQARALQAVALEMARRVERLRNAVDAYGMSLRLDALRASRWVDDAARPECAVCARRFHQLSRRRHHCRLCGEVICRDCSVHKDADLPTIGPTVLRICRQCDASTEGIRLQALQASSPPPSSSAVTVVSHQRSVVDNQESHRSSRMSCRRVTSIHTSSATLTPSAPTTPTVAAGSRAPKQSATPSKRVETKRRFSTTVDAPSRDSISQASSCPKPTPEHRPVASKFAAHNSESGARLAAKGMATTPTIKSHAYPSPMPGVWRAVGGTPSRWTGSSVSLPVSSHSTDASLAPSSTHRAKALSSASPPVQSPSKRWQRLSVDGNAGKPTRQTLAASPGPNQFGEASSKALPLTPRGVSKPREVQDVLVELCAQAAALCGAKYAALSLFQDQQLSSSASPLSLRLSRPSQQPEDDSRAGQDLAARMEHFLKVRGSHKLMNVAPNLKSCEPVLALRRSVATRDASAASARLGFDFQQLPIVAGPQQAHFYAGVLLVDTRGQWLGALAVFDSRVGVHKSEDRELEAMLKSMETLAGNAVAAVKEREKELALQTFLRSPLVETRSSEPGELTLVQNKAKRVDFRGEAIVERDGEEMEEDRRQSVAASMASPSAKASPHGGAREFYRRKMRELVQQAQQTQAQALENSAAMQRGGLIT